MNRPCPALAALPVAVLVAVLLVVAAAGCTTAAPPAPVQPAPSSAPSESSASAAPSPGSAPPVVRTPRVAAGIAGCAAATPRLTPDLVSATTAAPVGAGCTWIDRSGTAVLRADVRTGDGLAGLYRVANDLRAFRTGELSGAPTVVTTPESALTCSLHVGVSDRDVLVVQAGPATAPVRDPCGLAGAVAVRLLAAMPRASR